MSTTQSLCLFLFLIVAPAAAAQQVSLASVSSSGTQGNDFSTDVLLTPNGRFVAFTSYASNLVPGDTNDCRDVFVRDLATGQTTRVSVSTAGVQANNNCKTQAISSNGKVIAFTSNANNLVTPDTQGWTDLFVRDLETGITTRINSSPTGEEGNLGVTTNSTVGLTHDGRYVVFSSGSTNLLPITAPTDADGFSPDIFLHDRQTGATTMESLDSFGIQPNSSGSVDPCITPDGRFIAFVFHGYDMTPASYTWGGNVYRRDLLLGITDLISTSLTVGGYLGANSACATPAISDNGNLIAFHSTATNLVPQQSGFGVAHIYVRNFYTNLVWAVDNDGNGNLGNYPALKHPSISADGHHVLFQTRATNLHSATVGSGGSGNWLRASYGGSTFKLVSKTPTGAAGDNTSWLEVSAGISANGDVAAFASRASNLVAVDTNAASDAFVWGAAPTVQSTTPACGPLSGGTKLTITGEDFGAPGGSVNVTIGGSAATNISILSSTTLTCLTPPSTAGAKDIVVSTANGTVSLVGGYSYTANLEVYGTGTPGCLGVQEIAATALPKIGEVNFGFSIENCPANSLGLMLVTDSQDVNGSYPFGLGVMFLVDLLQASEILPYDVPSDADGRGTCSSPVPQLPALIGTSWYAQTIWVWSSCSLPPLNLSSSRALRLTIEL